MITFNMTKYSRWYYSIIKSASNRTLNSYTESHHIIPKSLGGSDDIKNLVSLTPREHFICHLLLVKMTEGDARKKMIYAAWAMTWKSKNSKRQHKITSRQYDYLRKQISESKKGPGNAAYGKTPWNKGLTKDTSAGMKKISDACIKKYKNPANRVGRAHSEETKLKISNLHKGVPKSAEHKKKLSDANKGKTISTETKIKLSEKLKGTKMPTGTCVYCNKEMSVGTLNRWHNENCKSKLE